MTDFKALRKLADDHHARTVRALPAMVLADHRVKPYVIEAPRRSVRDPSVRAMLRIANDHLASAPQRGSVGLAVVLMHGGGDGDYLLVHTWIEGYMSDLAVFTGPPDRPEVLRPGRAGLAPCVWEAAVLAHERDAFSAHVLGGNGSPRDRVEAWQRDVLQGEVR